MTRRKETQRIILHVDLDAFFASIEQRENPSLKGKPVIVGADPKIGRGVVSTASYEARKFGIHSAQPIKEAYKLCPHGIFLSPRIDFYKKVSKNIMKIL
ncbi:MAG TPA: DNA polymerase IV, partial [Candidatus Altiarchaeales archaeon]|nr:DNA polymerase IV [Candidatus Altiarchaeales archaeon]